MTEPAGRLRRIVARALQWLSYAQQPLFLQQKHTRSKKLNKIKLYLHFQNMLTWKGLEDCAGQPGCVPAAFISENFPSFSQALMERTSLRSENDSYMRLITDTRQLLFEN
jgi:hypothetical protein